MSIDLYNGGVEDKVHASFDAYGEIVREEVLGEFCGVFAGDVGGHNPSECYWDADGSELVWFCWVLVESEKIKGSEQGSFYLSGELASENDV
eukprot:scaffold300299_cov35-Attheya_sp.AAC.1